jgi:hypothetical protein
MPPPISPLARVVNGGRKVVSNSRLMSFRGKKFSQNVTQVVYPENEKRVMNADLLHKEGAQEFWCLKDKFHNPNKMDQRYMPVWDRSAQALILFTRNVVRVPQELAFRLLAVHLKILLVPSLTMMQSLTLPEKMTTLNFEALMNEAKAKAKEGKEPTEAGAAPSSPAGAPDVAPAADTSPKS